MRRNTTFAIIGKIADIFAEFYVYCVACSFLCDISAAKCNENYGRLAIPALAGLLVRILCSLHICGLCIVSNQDLQFSLSFSFE